MNLAIFGASGKMGTIVQTLAKQMGHNTIPLDASSDISAVTCDAVVDFSVSNAIEQVIQLATNNNCPTVIGTTGHSPAQLQLIAQLGEKLPVVIKSNFSIGISAIAEILPQLSAKLCQFDWQIVELHHKRKQDSPSGTAITLQNRINDSLPNKATNITSIRCADFCGTHTIIIANQYETINITHTANSRECFAQGAIKIAEQLLDKQKQDISN